MGVECARGCGDLRGRALESDRRGIESHGVNRFKPIYYDRIKDGIQQPVTNFEVVKKTLTTAVWTGTTAWASHREEVHGDGH